MSSNDPRDRTTVARIAAHTSWARTEDRTARTAPGRAALLARFERQVDPAGELDPRERARRADHARKAYFTALALRSARVRRANQVGLGTHDSGDATAPGGRA